MLGVLLESRAKRQRRGGGAALSVAVHVAIIGAVIVGTVQGKPAPKTTVEVHTIKFDAPVPKPRVISDNVLPAKGPPLPANVSFHQIVVPTITPTSLPAIDMTHAGAADTILFGGRESRGTGTGTDSRALDVRPADGGGEWRGNDVFMHILTPAKPRYPESLRSAGVDGRVLVQFTVDTTGRIDLKSVKVLSSTHELFARAVKEALPAFRFRPAESGGKHVAALAEMPFEFQISR